MAQDGPDGRPSRARLLTGLLMLLLLLGGGFLLLPGVAPPATVAGSQPPVSAAPPPPVVAGLVPAVPTAVVPPPASVAPSFDLVRVSPRGEVVIAGRAEPGTEVVVRDGGSEIARVRVDRSGAFVATPAETLGQGARSLTLTSEGSASAGSAPAAMQGDGAVVVVVPPRPAPGMAPPVPLAVLVPRAAAPRVLQGEQSAGGSVGLDSVEYDDRGGIRFAGRAAASGTIRVYVDNKPVGDAVPESGRWTLTPREEVSEGVHKLRIDRIDPAGQVQARVELPFQRASVPAAEVAGGRMVVQPGQNLWRMARAAYGSGVRYTVIYLANRDQIRDPRLIYPGQAIAVPQSSP